MGHCTKHKFFLNHFKDRAREISSSGKEIKFQQIQILNFTTFHSLNIENCSAKQNKNDFEFIFSNTNKIKHITIEPMIDQFLISIFILHKFYWTHTGPMSD